MITPDEIIKKAEKAYPLFLRAWLAGENFFPLNIRADRGKSTDPFLIRKTELETLVQKSKSIKKIGYSLIFKEVKTRERGTQSVVSKILFDTAEDFLACLGKSREFQMFCHSATLIRNTLPQLESWIGSHLTQVIKHSTVWPDLLAVCSYFINHPAPRLYIRELPIAVHTKFIEEHKAVLKLLLDSLLPPTAINSRARDFSKRYKLKKAAILFRIRSLDPTFFIHGMNEVALTVTALATQELAVKTVIIIENLMTFLTFPVLEGGLAIWGKGFKAAKLKDVRWLTQKRLIYWGDIDTPGFEILSQVRRHFLHVRSFLMDFATYKAFQLWAVPFQNTRQMAHLHLTPQETELYDWLCTHPAQARLEQERISQEHVIKSLTSLTGY